MVRKNNRALIIRDISISIILGMFIFVLLYYLLGFGKYGLNTPFFYNGWDDFQSLFQTKNISQNGWLLSTDRVGAPFETHFEDYPVYYLWNCDVIITKLISMVTHNVITTQNLQILLNFSMCAVSAYLVLRVLKIEWPISLIGGILFCLSPYIQGRITLHTHFHLATCYMVPISILLCIWCCNESYSTKYNWILSIIFCLLIANNGIGYYAFFTCIFLCITAIYNMVNSHNLRSCIRPLGYILCITLFLFLALSPVFFFWWQHGVNTISVRNPSESEVHGLKIAQFFVPINSHGLSFVKKYINNYNNSMFLIGENQTSYLGIAGIIGFGISLIYILNKKNMKEELLDVYHLCIMIIFGIMVATVGGFSGLASLLIQFIRAYNRISIFISFICICIFCIYCNKWVKAAFNHTSKKLKYGMITVLVIIIGLCLYDVVPTPGANDEIMAQNRVTSRSDAKFVRYIENILNEDDMVYQFPYHQFPEAGHVNDMKDYRLFAGYLFSEKLKWSYGGIKGRDSDMWNQELIQKPIKEQIDEIFNKGFRGIYIETRAYTKEELDALIAEIESLTGQEPVISDDKKLLFFNLYPYSNRK